MWKVGWSPNDLPQNINLEEDITNNKGSSRTSKMCWSMTSVSVHGAVQRRVSRLGTSIERIETDNDTAFMLVKEKQLVSFGTELEVQKA